MRHCKSCKHCILDLQALDRCRVVVYKCAIKGYCILRPFFKGMWCKEWNRRADNG